MTNWHMPLPKSALFTKDDVILYAYRGSQAHGTYIPSTEPHSIDDIDTMGVFIYPELYYLGVPEAKYRQTVEVMQDEWDVVYYEIRHFIRLLMKSNPNVLMMLFLREQDYLQIHPLGRQIIDNKHLFVSRYAAKTFVGYARAQLKKMTAYATGLGYMGQKRRGLVEKFGYDTKNASHCIRLLRMGYEFLQTGEMKVFRPDAQELIDIKTGKWPLDKVKQIADEMFEGFDAIVEKSPLPERPNREGINMLLVSMMKEHFGWRSY